MHGRAHHRPIGHRDTALKPQGRSVAYQPGRPARRGRARRCACERRRRAAPRLLRPRRVARRTYACRAARSVGSHTRARRRTTGHLVWPAELMIPGFPTHQTDISDSEQSWSFLEISLDRPMHTPRWWVHGRVVDLVAGASERRAASGIFGR
jgi:hypothetical protein